MKKMIMAFVLCLVSTTMAFAYGYIILNDGRKINGSIDKFSDTSLVFIVDGQLQKTIIPVSEITSGLFGDGNKLTVENGKFKVITKEDMKRAKEQKRINDLKGNPNLALAKAIKVAGSTSLGIGIPCLTAGVITCIVGNTGKNTPIEFRYDGEKYKVKPASEAREASYYLFGIGAALTIIGIPLYVKGNELYWCYKGNEVSVTYKF